MNRIILAGRLTRDPEIRTYGDDKKLCRYSIAVNRRFANAEGVREADFFDCVNFGGSAEFVTKYFHKGDPIIIDGEMRTENYTDKDGNNRISYSVNVNSVEFSPGGRKHDSNSEPSETIPDTAVEDMDKELGKSAVVDSDDDLPW